MTRYGTLAAAIGLLTLPALPVLADEGENVAYDWSGVYVGIGGGYGWGDMDIDTRDSATWYLNGLEFLFSSDGALVGGTLGANTQSGRFVLGVEGDLSAAFTSGHSDPVAFGGAPTVIETELDWLATLRARAGYAVLDRLLVYATGGVAIGGVSGEVSNFPSDGLQQNVDGTQLGYVVGAGFEAALSRHVTLKAEYLRVDLGSDSYLLAPGHIREVTADLNPTFDIVRAGLNYKF